VANAGVVVATIEVDPDGNVSVVNNGNLTANANGNLSATIGGTSSINSTGNMEFTAPQITFNGATIINGTTQANGSITGTSTITAPNINGTTNVMFGGKSGTGHQHGNVQNGSGDTGAPI
jgi:hypothetical protein